MNLVETILLLYTTILTLFLKNLQKGRFWRKNRKPNNGSRCIGTDLNRNWAYKWGGRGTWERANCSKPCIHIYQLHLKTIVIQRKTSCKERNLNYFVPFLDYKKIFIKYELFTTWRPLYIIAVKTAFMFPVFTFTPAIALGLSRF